MELIARNIFEKGYQLNERNYKELGATFPTSSCDAVLVNHTTKQFWFTQKEDAEKIIGLVQKQS